MFSYNTAHHGGAISYYNNSYIYFEETSTTIFSNNAADKGGAVLAEDHCNMIFDCSSIILFENNTAAYAATIFCFHDSKIIVKQGHSSILFNNILAKWCANVCLPYPGETDAVIIDSNGLVWCNNLKAFNCLSDKCKCKDLENILGCIKNNQLVNITAEVVVLSSVIDINSLTISIIGHDNLFVICVNGGGLKIKKCDNLTIEGITWIGCGATEAIDVSPSNYTSVLAVTHSINVTIQKCSFQYSVGKVIGLTEVSGYVNIIDCIFVNNSYYKGYGTAIYYKTFNVFL